MKSLMGDKAIIESLKGYFTPLGTLLSEAYLVPNLLSAPSRVRRSHGNSQKSFGKMMEILIDQLQSSIPLRSSMSVNKSPVSDPWISECR